MRPGLASALSAVALGALLFHPGSPPAAAGETTVVTPAAVAVTPAPADDGHVWSVRPQADGTVAYTVYRSAPGVTAAALYASLRAQGIAGLREPAAFDPYSCYRGTAYALEHGRCPPIRWRWNGFSDPQIHFRDHTPAAWPVRASVTAWHRAVGVDSYWTTGSCPAGGRHCVRVYSGYYGATGWTGNTSYRIDSSRYFIDGSVWTELNDYYATSAADRRNTTCHELGHALGVGHNLSAAGCMYGPDTASNPPLPHSSDYNLLRYVLYP